MCCVIRHEQTSLHATACRRRKMVSPGSSPGSSILDVNTFVASLHLLLSCIHHHTGWREGWYQRTELNWLCEEGINKERGSYCERRKWGEELKWEEIMMQLAREPLRILGKAPLRPVVKITWWLSAVMRPGRELHLHKHACVDERLWPHPPLFIIWHCPESASSPSINLFVFHALAVFAVCVTQLFVSASVHDWNSLRPAADPQMDALWLH